MVMSRAEMVTKIAELGYDEWYWADVAFAIAEGNDEGGVLLGAITEIAGKLGISEDSEDWELLCDIANDETDKAEEDYE